MRAVLATRNDGKVAELGATLAPLGFELVSMDELGLGSPEETGLTFIENALIKARAAADASGLPAIADDSGLVVPALGGAPGIRSSRFAGDDASDADNNAKLVALLADEPDTRAHFYCAMAYLRSAGDPTPLVATGAWHGTIVREPRGSNGFGYDPHFAVDGIGLTAAELDAATKNRSSHRALASAALVRLLAASQDPDAP